jgi:hypothetical protein
MANDYDPRVPPNNSLTGGIVFKNFFYEGVGDNLRLFDYQQKSGTKDANQKTVPPFNPNMHAKHPCIDANVAVGKCNESCERTMMQAGRVAMCNKERHALMKCLASNKKWVEPEPQPWWKLF